MSDYFIGVDVGTGSVRAGLVTREGHVSHVAVQNITRVSPAPGYYLQSSREIWSAVCDTVTRVLDQSHVSSHQVKGLGFTGTCSLVVVTEDGSDVGLCDDQGFDVIMWMDHRAEIEAGSINKTKHRVLDYVGGGVSLEMQMPKLLWLKNHRPDVWQRASKYFDLPDWLVYRATQTDWNYDVKSDGTVPGWNDEYLSAIGLSDLADDDHVKIGKMVLPPGSLVSHLSEASACDLGLCPETPVSTSLIDAHAGALGMLAGASNIYGRLGLVSGTSTCHMLLSRSPTLVSGVWGPFWSAVLPGSWLMEGGQSSTGGLLDHVISSHPSYSRLVDLATEAGSSVFQVLDQRLDTLSDGHVALLTRDLHVWPDFHGNRSPLADPSIKGAVVGLTLQSDLDSLALYYLATVQAICYGTRHIVETLVAAGHCVNSVTVCGGLSKSKIFLQTQADILGMAVIVPEEKESVLLGAAMLGMSAASGGCLVEVTRNISMSSTQVSPCPEVEQYHEAKYKVFKEMIEDQLKYRKIMKQYKI